jgi:exopolyphosphatase/guanosine-5'-triphosphate,3'-diphosphate pyrophosphatase
MKYAVLDCGTNTFNLLVVEKEGDDFRTIYNEKFPVKIGKGGIHKGVLTSEALDRARKAIAYHMSTIKELKVDQFQCFATSAMRDTGNGPEFRLEMKKTHGLEMQIIDGDREAQLIYQGVQAAMPIEVPSLIMDIGGGSTEFILADANGIQWKKSYPLGVSRLLEIIQPADPVSENDIRRLKQHLDDALAELYALCDKHKPIHLIGSSGSFDTLVEMIAKNLKGQTDFELPKSQLIEEADFRKIEELLLPSTLAERLQMKGLVHMRAEMIVFSMIIIRHIKENLKLRQTFLSAYALKEGALLEMVKRD